MKFYSAYCDEVGLDRNTPIPEKKWIYWAYKAGESFGPLSTIEEARKISTNTERVECPIQKKIRDEFIQARNKKEGEAYDLWHADLRKEFRGLNDETFGIIYSEAYDRGHSSGYDEVAGYMNDLEELALRIIDANKK